MMVPLTHQRGLPPLHACCSNICSALSTFQLACPPLLKSPLLITSSNSWKKAKEYTTAGISGLHFGMYKAQAHDPDLTQYNATHRLITFCSGILYDCWLKGVVNVMLLKSSGNTRSDKLHTIALCYI